MIRGEAFEGQNSIMAAAFPNEGERIVEFTAHGENFYDFGWRCVITKNYKLAVCRGMDYGLSGKSYLYDLQNDPNENVDIDSPDIKESMLKELEQWCDATGDGFYRGYIQSIKKQ